jgi:A/G-specific adenine glycosylase
MLQQTQAPRVVSKYLSFLKKFPDFESLAKANLPDVLTEWQGLGYNRRGMYLKKIAETISLQPSIGQLPRTYEDLIVLPGIGPNTAGSILAFAYNIPWPFIETNIRSVYIHFFFAKTKRKITDTEILSIVEKTLDKKNAREWFFALMDYGVMIKSSARKDSDKTGLSDPARKSALYKKQSTFKGSNRELRAKILRFVLTQKIVPSNTTKVLSDFKKKNPEYPMDSIVRNFDTLKKEGLLG